MSDQLVPHRPSKEFCDIFGRARRSIMIVGTHPLAPDLERAAQFFADLLLLNPSLSLTILYESDSENFHQALCVDTPFASSRRSFSGLSIHRDRIAGVREGTGMRSQILASLSDRSTESAVIERVLVRQINLRLPLNMIEVDGEIRVVPTTYSLPTLGHYQLVTPTDPWHSLVGELSAFYTSPERAGVFLSSPSQELIQLYDRQGVPRGIYPRACFYTTRYQRYSIWGFVFNRNGQVLLHRRSPRTKDNRLLWDKSIGGHVDLLDKSSIVSAQRELIEELFLPEDEFTKYVRAELGDIVNYGEWYPKKRTEVQLRGAFTGLGPSDWILFRATDHTGDPLTVTRKSIRRIHDGDIVRRAPTIFMSDVYLFIAPKGFIDTEQQMRRLFDGVEEQGAAVEHRLVTVEELREWVEECQQLGTDEETFTDDLLFVTEEYLGMLEQFASFVRFVFA